MTDGRLHERARRVLGCFRTLTGLEPEEFDALGKVIEPKVQRAEQERLDHEGRRRAIGGGPAFGLDLADQTLLVLIRARHRPTLAGLSVHFGVSMWTAMRTVQRLGPILCAARPDLDPTPRGDLVGDEVVRAILIGPTPLGSASGGTRNA